MVPSGKVTPRKLHWPENGVSVSDTSRKRISYVVLPRKSNVKIFFYAVILMNLISVLLFCGCTSPKDIVATIDDEPITRCQLKNRLNAYDEKTVFADAADSEDQKQLTNTRAALTQLINERLLLIEARNLKILTERDERDPEKCKQAIRKVLIRLGEKVAFPSYQEAFAYYDKHPDKFVSKRRYQLDHLLLKSENQAWKLKEKLEKGELSIDEAAQQQTHGARAANSNNQRLITIDELPVGVAAVLPDLKINQISQPIASSYGYHLIIIRKIVPAGTIPFLEVENKIKDSLFAERLKQNYQHWLEQNRKQHTIKIYHKHLTGL